MIVKAIPKNTKMATGSAAGSYIAHLGLRGLGIGIFTNEIGMGNFMESTIFIVLLGLILTIILTVCRVKGAALAGIIAVTVMRIPLGVTILPDASIKMPDFSSWGNTVLFLGFKGLSSLQAIIYVLIASYGGFFSTLGTVLGAAGKAGMLDEDGNMPGMPMSMLRVL